MTLELMLTVLWLGLFAAGSTVLIRVLPGISVFVEKGMKPWACDKCMSFWLILFAVAGLPHVGEALHYTLSSTVFLIAGPAAYAVSLFMLRALTEPLGPPPSFGGIPDLIDLDVPEISGGKTYIPPFSDPPPAH